MQGEREKIFILIMKPKLLPQILITIVVLCSSGAAPAQRNPIPPAPVVAGWPVAIDPTTGQPLAQGIPDWKDPNWKDPDLILTNVSYREGVPLPEVIRNIRDLFHGQFDIITPVNWGNNPYNPPLIDPANGQPVAVAGSSAVDLSVIAVTLELKNVTASELFNAMNLIFENDRTPLRWELKLNGKRQVALLRVLTDPVPTMRPLDTRSQLIRRVYFVGDLIGEEKTGGMTMDQLIQTVQAVWKTTYNEPAALQFHKEAQLLIVSGTSDQIDFAQDLLNALKQRANLSWKGTQDKELTAQQKAAQEAMAAAQRAKAAALAAQQQVESKKTTDLKPSGK
jgi:hypothetical protein